MQAAGADNDLIDIAGKISLRQILLLVVGSLVLFTDGFAAQQMNVVSTAVVADWHLSKEALAPVFAANVYGLMLGTLLVAPLADIFSRRLITIASVAAFGLFSLMPLLAHDVAQLQVIRLLHGLALGAAFPCAIAAVSDYLPKARRTDLGVALTCGFALGSAAVGLVAAAVLDRYGWRPIFLIGGVLPLILVPLLWALLPESPAYLIRKGRDDKLRAILKRVAPDFVYTPRPLATQPKAFGPVGAVGQLFSDGRAPMTLLIWLAYFATGASLYFLQSWLPTLSRGFGFDASQGAAASSCYQFGGLFGGFLVGYAAGRKGLAAFVATYFLAAAAIALTGLGSGSVGLFWAMSALCGVFVVGGQNAINVYVGGTLYPTQMRAAGLGLALACTRLSGGILGSTFAGVIVSWELGPQKTFSIVAIPEVVTALTLLALLLWRRSRRVEPQAVLAPG